MDLAGAVDTHVHSAPDVVARSMDDHQLARAARAAGYAAVVLKSHVESTAGRARLVSTRGLRVYGGVCLNQHSTGGVNPAAVEACLRMSGRFIWLPTFTAASARTRDPMGSPFGRVRGHGVRLVVDGALTGEMHEVLDLVAEHDAVLATGHIVASELQVVVREAASHGVRRVLIQHPESVATRMSIAEQRALLAVNPDVVFERCLRSVCPDVTAGRVPSPGQLAPIVSAVRELGADRTVLATDYGLAEAADPVTAMRCYVEGLLAAGLSEREVATMLQTVPARLLGGMESRHGQS